MEGRKIWEKMLLVHISSIRYGGNENYWAQKSTLKKLMKSLEVETVLWLFSNK